MRQEIGAVLTLETVAVIGGMASISAGAHAVGIGFVADVVIVGGGVVCFSAEGWRAGKEFLLFWKTATESNDDRSLDKGANHFAHAVSIVGINVFVAILAHRMARKDAVLARSAFAIESIRFERIRNRVVKQDRRRDGGCSGQKGRTGKA